MKRGLWMAAAIGLIVASSTPASAKSCGGVSLPASIKLGETKLSLNGMGIRKATIFNVQVYVAGLYLEKTTRDATTAIQSEQTKRIVMHFVRDVERDQVHEALRDGLKKSGMTGKKVQALLGMVPAMKNGSALSLTYLPGKGTVVHIGRTEKGTIEGADFAKAWVQMFVGATPPNAELKTGLLGGDCS